MLSVTAMYSFVTIQSYCLGRPTAQAGAVGWAGSLLGELGCG